MSAIKSWLFHIYSFGISKTAATAAIRSDHGAPFSENRHPLNRGIYESSNKAREGRAIDAQCQFDDSAPNFLNTAATSSGLVGAQRPPLLESGPNDCRLGRPTRGLTAQVANAVQ
jgi:hypothetical protein